MSSAEQDTIAAIATAPGRGGIGIVRVSGADLAPIAQQILGIIPKPRYAHFVSFLDEKGGVLDKGVALFFPAPYSFTGEDILELHGHGGPVVLNLILQCCLRLGARLAQPGEFTQRAFLNDKIDLAQAEAVADLIDAGSVEAARSAMRSLSGEFSKRISQLVESLINLRMLVEATLDFPEEELEFLQSAKAFERLEIIRQQVTQIENAARQGSLLRDGIRVVLIGQPNVGKSSLLNQLAGQDVAIVTARAGTTRDTVRETIQIDGVPIHIIDTAGLHDTEDEVELIGIERTWMAISHATVGLLLVDAQHGLTLAEQNIIAALPADLPLFTVHNKIDLMPENVDKIPGDIYISAKTGAGMETLRATLLNTAGWHGENDSIFLARERHIAAIQTANMHLEKASQLPSLALEFLAEELRLAQMELSKITGAFSADDLLGEIFTRFCIGK